MSFMASNHADADPRRPALATAALLVLVAAGLWTGCAPVIHPAETAPAAPTETSEADLRVALFNIRELDAGKLGEVGEDGVGSHPQLRAAAAVVQRVRPDVLVVQEIDFPEAEGAVPASPVSPSSSARAFADRYLAHPQPGGGEPLDYPHAYAAPVNTGILSGLDLNRDGRVATPADRGERVHGDDSLGWGTYPGQYGMAVLSRFPLDAPGARTFREFLWRDLPGNHLPPDWYDEAALGVLPLSSKSHWDLPVEVPGADVPLHLWISHPTPPVFDGEEDRNGRRNFDEVRFWKLYADGAPELVDDAGRSGGYAAGHPFVVVGDLNADPQSPEAVYDGVQSAVQLLTHPDMADAGALLTSRGGAREDRIGGRHPERSTADFDPAMRLDHLIPGGGAEAVAGGVFWPAGDADPTGAELAATASDHRLVWLDVRLPRGAGR